MVMNTQHCHRRRALLSNTGCHLHISIYLIRQKRPNDWIKSIIELLVT